MKKRLNGLFVLLPCVLGVMPIAACSLLIRPVNSSDNSSAYMEEKVEISYAGTYEIKDYYDLSSEKTYSNVLFLNCSVANNTNRTLKYMKIDSFKVYNFDNELVAMNSWGCTGLLNLSSRQRTTYPFLFQEKNTETLENGYYDPTYFTPTSDEVYARIEFTYVANPTPAYSGLTINYNSYHINSQYNTLVLNVDIVNDTGVTVKTLALNRFRVFHYDSENSKYTKVVDATFPNSATLNIANGSSYNINNLTMAEGAYNGSFWNGTVNKNNIVVVSSINFTY